MPQDKKYLRFPVHILKTDDELGVVEAIVSVFGNMDLQLDVIDKGAFTKTIVERMGDIVVLDAHRSNSVMDIVGKPLEMREVSKEELPLEILKKYPEATGGLYTRTQYAMATEKGKSTFDLIKGGYVKKYSIGFQIVKSTYEERNSRKVRVIKEVKLYEYSPVVFAANEATATVSYRSAESKMSISRMVDKVTSEFMALYPPELVYDSEYDDHYYDYSYIPVEVYPKLLIVKCNKPDMPYAYYSIKYQIDDEGKVMFDSIEKWKGGNYIFVAGEKENTKDHIDKSIAAIHEKLDSVIQRLEKHRSNPLAEPVSKPLTRDEVLERFRSLQKRFQLED